MLREFWIYIPIIYVLEQDPAATEEAANFGGKREVLAEKGQGKATTA